MRHLVIASVLAAAFFASPARSEVSVQISLGLPAQPPLVAVQPGVMVVEDFHEEVFYVGGYYWLRRDGLWYRAPSPRVAFVYVEPRRVPPGLTRLPPGHYRHFRKEQARAEHRAWKERERAEHRAWKDQAKAEQRERKERGKGGHGKHGER